MEQRQGDEHILHIFVSNQSIAIDVSDIEVTINGQQIFHREMATGTQHNWGEVTIPVVSGEHMVVLTEAKTQTRTSETINVDCELWYSPANTLIMRKSLIHNLLHDKGSSVQVVDIECLILNQNISG